MPSKFHVQVHCISNMLLSYCCAVFSFDVKYVIKCYLLKHLSMIKLMKSEKCYLCLQYKNKLMLIFISEKGEYVVSLHLTKSWAFTGCNGM